MASIILSPGGTENNTGTITGKYYGLAIYGGVGTVTNSGAMTATASGLDFGRWIGHLGFLDSDGVLLGDGGTVTNEVGGTITGKSCGVSIYGASATVSNSGSITSKGGAGFVLNSNFYYENYSWGVGVLMHGGGTVTNNKGGKISGYVAGITISYGAGTVTNAGEITETRTFAEYQGYTLDGRAAINLNGGGTVVNQAGGSIEGGVYGVYVKGGAGSVTNSGSITGTRDSIEFVGSGANTLTLESGSKLTGAVVGSLATGASNALTLEGAGTASNAFDNFDTLTVDASGLWTLGAAATIGATTVSTGTLIIGGGLTTALTESAGTTLRVAKSETLTLDGTSSLAGAVSGPGTLAVTAGTTTIESGAKLTVANLKVSGGMLTLDADLTYYGTVTQSGGAVTVGDNVKTDKAELSIGAHATWTISGKTDIDLGADTASWIVNAGVFEKNGSSGGSRVVASFANDGAVDADTGTLTFDRAVSGTGSDVVSGASTLDFHSTVSKGQTVSFTGSAGTLDLGDLQGFAGKIDGFDIVGSSDTLLVGGSWTYGGAMETATSTTLTFTKGASDASLVLTGDYVGGTFTHQSLTGGVLSIGYS